MFKLKQQELLHEWITEDKRELRMHGVKILRQIDTPTLVEKLSQSIVRISLSPMPLTTEAGRLGKAILEGLEDLTRDEGKINLARIQVGLQLLRILIDKEIMHFYRMKEDKHQYIIDVLNDDFVNAIFFKIPSKELPYHTQPLYSKPEKRETFVDRLQGQLVHKINYANIDKYLYSRIPVVYDVVNRLQGQGYCVNTDALKVVESCKDDEMFTLKERRKQLVAKGFEKDVIEDKVTGVKREHSMTLHKANEVGDDTFWCSIYLDTRGRKYYSTQWLNPQGGKLAKSLYYFADVAPLGTSGLFFLKYQVANTWGEDKLSIDDRVSFVEDNIDWILEIGKNPKTDKRWQEADSPFEFLVAAMELYKASQLDDPTLFESGLPVAFDATCSGLQWLAILSKDKNAGALCNLTDSDTIGDYYTYIADFAWKHKDLPAVFKNKFNDRRTIVKRSCMTIWYSAGAKTMGRHIWVDHGSKYYDVTKEDCMALGKILHTICLEKMEGPAKIMKLLMQLGEAEARSGKDLSLTMPVDDFPFIQTYRGNNKGVVKFHIGERVLRLSYITEYNTWIRIRDVLTGSPANYIHALDAQLVSKLILIADYPVIPIHDSFSVRPCDAGKVYEDLRTAFVSIVKDDVLMESFGEIDREYLLKDLKTGSLDVTEVLDNEFAFS